MTKSPMIEFLSGPTSPLGSRRGVEADNLWNTEGGEREERKILLTVQLLPEGVYLGTSDDIQGLVVQADTIADLLDYADDIAGILIEHQTGRRPDRLTIEYHEQPYIDVD